MGFAITLPSVAEFDQALHRLWTLEAQHSQPALIAFAKAISWIGGGAQRYIIVTLFVLALWRWRGWAEALALAGASLLSSQASNLLKYAYARPRPADFPHLDSVDSPSFPSGHATSAAAVYLLLIWLLPPEWRKFSAPLLVALTLATGISRIQLGVHYPTDVMAGWMLGVAFALLAWSFVPKRAT
jgi:undecaprenyl-diphosphatase